MIDITAVVNVVLVLAAFYIGLRIVMLLTLIRTTLLDIRSSLHAREDDHA